MAFVQYWSSVSLRNRSPSAALLALLAGVVLLAAALVREVLVPAALVALGPEERVAAVHAGLHEVEGHPRPADRVHKGDLEERKGVRN